MSAVERHRVRTVLALGLMAAYYGAITCLPATLFAVTFIDWLKGRGGLSLVFGSFFVGVMILWALFPRLERFCPLGPRIDRSSQPELLAAIEEVAVASGQPVPREIYLTMELNAAVAERGGLFGLGSRRAMALGVPLLQVLSVSEFKGIVAHEFGHFRRGDTRLQPWLARINRAIGRSLEVFDDSMLGTPFVVYGRSFRRITNGMTRSQEHAADAHAASIVGKGAVVTGLRSMHAAAPAYTVYWTREVVPVLDAGFRPPITAGFELFRHAPTTRAEIARQLESDAAHSQATPDDSYPTLAERTQAIEALPDASAPIATDDRRAIGLLRGISEVELQVLRFTGGEGPAGELKPIEWDAVPELAFLPMWRRCCEEHADKLRGLRTADLPKRARPLGDEIARALPATAAHDQRGPAIGRAAEELGLYGAAVAVALYDRGHRLEAGVGQPIVFRNRDATATPVPVDPFESMCALSEGRLGGSEWDSICRAFRIDTVALESAAAARRIGEVAHADRAPR